MAADGRAHRSAGAVRGDPGLGNSEHPYLVNWGASDLLRLVVPFAPTAAAGVADVSSDMMMHAASCS